MSDHDKDALQYTLSQRSIRDGSIFRCWFDPAATQGLNVAKLGDPRRHAYEKMQEQVLVVDIEVNEASSHGYVKVAPADVSVFLDKP